tara:strand:- start:144 stop:485 length:342 start_codon:yes stop_codon:yes gene_type:complete
MPRHENESVDFPLTDPPMYAIIAYTEKMEEINEDHLTAYCKVVVRSDNDSAGARHYIKFDNGKMFDPWGINAGRERALNLEYRKVSEKSFELFTRYLKTRNSRYFLHSEREAL